MHHSFHCTYKEKKHGDFSQSFIPEFQAYNLCFCIKIIVNNNDEFVLFVVQKKFISLTALIEYFGKGINKK